MLEFVCLPWSEVCSARVTSLLLLFIIIYTLHTTHYLIYTLYIRDMRCCTYTLSACTSVSFSAVCQYCYSVTKLSRRVGAELVATCRRRVLVCGLCGRCGQPVLDQGHTDILQAHNMDIKTISLRGGLGGQCPCTPAPVYGSHLPGPAATGADVDLQTNN